MVRCAALLLFLLQQTICSAIEPPGGYYTTRYDHLDVENILNQKRLVHYYAACLLDKGPCTPQGIEFKNILPEAIKTNCLRCTEKQRVVTLRSIRRLRKEYPDIWSQLEASWDPTGVYVKRLEGSVNKPIPMPVTPESTSNNVDPDFLSNRFQDPTEQKRVAESTTIKSSTIQTPISTSSPVTTTPRITSTTSGTTLKFIISTLKPKTTTQKFTTKRIVNRPFSSIGPNLVIPNPKAFIDQVISTAGAVLNSVTNTVTNTVVTVFKG